MDVESKVNPLWDYSLVVYARPEVASLLLELQESVQANVNVLLCCSWLATEGVQLQSAKLREVLAIIGDWDDNCVQALRALRQYLKTAPEGQAMREQIKALELQAERHQQNQLQAFFACQVEQARASINASALRELSVCELNFSRYADQLGEAMSAGCEQQLRDLARLLHPK